MIMYLILIPIMEIKAEIPIYQNDSYPIEVRVEDALNRMTLDEKVAM